MGELKPIGSEKLIGNAKIKRILELTYYQSENSSNRSAEIVKESKTGVYGVVKEKDGYYVKKGLNENSLDYIGGLFMKNKNKFDSYGEAFKKLEFLTEQENIQEATKYVLKQNKPTAPQTEAPSPIPTGEPPAPAAAPDPTALDTPDPTAGDTGNDFGSEDPNATPEDPNDYIKVIQKMTGKLTQKLGVYKEKLESKDIKYVINMVLGAVDLDKLDDADKTEITDHFEEDPNAEVPGGESGDTEGTTAPSAENDLGETQVDGMDALEELINTPFEDDNVFDDDEDDIQSPDIRDFEDKRASRHAEKDYSRENSKVDDDDDDEDPESPLDMDLSGDEEDEDELTSRDKPLLEVPGEEEKDNVKEIDIEELTSIVNNSVKDSLSKYFN